jgi:hypothetical protein
MGVQAIYSDNGLLGDRIVKYCPKLTDFSFTSQYWDVPVVVDISKQSCRPNLYTKDSGVINTNGCCVLDFSYQNCHEIINVKDDEEEFYDMNIRYLDTSTQEERKRGERKICYTAPLKKKPLHIMYLLREIAVDIAALIAIVLVGACYEYWIIYGNCIGNSIETLLSDAPYSVNEYIMKREDSYTIKMSKDCNASNAKSSSEKVEWYDTFPYNIITFFNKPLMKTKTTESISDDDLENSKSSNGDSSPNKIFTNGGPNVFELVKIPIRAFLLGFFNFIIISKILIKAIVMLVSEQLSEFFIKQDSKLRNFVTGLIFILIFMGLWGNITDRYVGELPWLNVSCLFLVAALMIVALGFGGVVSVIYSFISFVGYRKGSYEKYVINPQPLPKDEVKKSKTALGSVFAYLSVEKFESLWDWYWAPVFFLFKSKRTLLSDEETELLSNIDESQIRNEEILNWFFPIRRSELVIPWGFKFFWGLILKFCNLELFMKCRKDDVLVDYNFFDKLYWYSYSMWKRKINLFSPVFTLDVDCDEVNSSKFLRAKDATPMGTFSLFTIWLLIVLYIRSHMFVFFFLLLLAAALVLPFINILWMALIFIVIIYSLMFSVFGGMFAFFFMFFYILIGFFYIPAKNYTKLFQIIKNHGNMLTILFCIVVVVHGVKVLHPTSAGVVGGLLALLILYKLITTFSV